MSRGSSYAFPPIFSQKLACICNCTCFDKSTDFSKQIYEHHECVIKAVRFYRVIPHTIYTY